MIIFSTYVQIGFTNLFRNPILLVSWIMLSSSGLSMTRAIGIRAMYVKKYAKPLRRRLRRGEEKKSVLLIFEYASPIG